MLKLSDLANDRRTITVVYGPHTVTLTYRPSGWDNDFATRLGGRALTELIAELVSEWDVEDVDPSVRSQLEALPVPFLRTIWNAVGDDVFRGGPGRELGEASGPSDAS